MRNQMGLPRNREAPGLARRRLTHWYEGALGYDELQRARLLASELVTNAVIHGEGDIQLNAELDDDRLVVDVLDQGSGFEHQVRDVPFEQYHGRGLAIVDAESSRWGIHDGTTHVWFEIERSGPRLGAESRHQG